MKKLISIILALAICLSLTACLDPKAKPYKEAMELMTAGDYQAAAEAFEALEDYEDAPEKALACRYEIAVQVYQSEDFAEAAELFKKISGHKDSTEMAEKCLREIGMRENADYAFFADLEAVVINFLENSDDVFHAPSDVLYNAMAEELETLKKYKDETFFDERVHELALMYIEGTEVLQSKVSASFWGEQQPRSLKGMALRYSALTELCNSYGFMADNTMFITSVVAQNDKYQKAYVGLTAVREDLLYQLENADFNHMINESTGTLLFTVTNNTEYSYSAILLMELMDVRNVLLQETTVVGIKNLQPGESCEVILKNVENVADFWHFKTSPIIAMVDNLDVGDTEVITSDPEDTYWTGWYPDLILME